MEATSEKRTAGRRQRGEIKGGKHLIAEWFKKKQGSYMLMQSVYKVQVGFFQ